MLKNRKAVLLNAITMGTLLANGGVGSEGEDDKHGKDFKAPLYNDNTPYIRNILASVDERADIRRNLLRKPIKVDCRGKATRGASPFHKVLNTLLVDAQKYNLPLTLTLLNATEAELNEILNHKNASFIEKLDWSYDAPLINDIDAYDVSEDGNTEKGEESTNTLGNTEIPQETSGSKGDDIHPPAVEDSVKNILSGVDERANKRRELLRKPIKIDLRGEAIRGVSPLQKVLNILLVDAQKYDVPLNLTLLNATTPELNELLSHTNASFIKELDWSYDAPLIDNMDAYDWFEDEADGITETTGFTPTPEDGDEEWIDETAGFTPTPEDDDEEWIDETSGFTPTSGNSDAEDSDEEWIEDPVGFNSEGSDEEWIPVEFNPENHDDERVENPMRVNQDELDKELIYDLFEFMRDAPVEEQANDLLRLMRDDVPAEEQAENLLELVRDVPAEEQDDDLLRPVRDVPEEEQADDYEREFKAEPRVTRWKRAVARAKYMPSLEELVDDFGQKGTIAPLQEAVQEIAVNEDILPTENEVDSPQLTGWSMTLVKNAEGNNDASVQDSSQLKNITNRASHNLVELFCRGG